ncbi:hypothetical protein E1265_13890 [Streptomyces sp. 8K308]|uniref:hypothetical protein n=1 Tax=Streptomyces sp. 8K308 TaxID=2530388 RepID=UPI0010437244|nr:hypothetical protein [Streptomyces sp. 8K308]TDC23059.1 hypothetical protein E1265_13890 [Streptomyces sp. 8K308]
MSQNQPGSYGQPDPYGAPQPGQQPGGPNPYARPGGAPGGSGSPGYGYPQGQQPGPPPPPGGGYGQQPPSPYGQQPPQQPQYPGAYGQQPPPPPGQPGQPDYGQQPPYGAPSSGGGRKNRTGLIVVAVVVALAVIGGGAFLLVGGDDSEDGSGGDGTRYELALPETTGDFTLAAPASSTEDISEEELAAAGMAEAEGTTGTYLGGITPEELAGMQDLSELGDRVINSMLVVGMWGAVEDPEAAVDALLAYGASEGVADQGGAELTLIGEPQEMNPEGLDGAVMKCQQGSGVEPTTNQTIQIPLCVWADDSTVGMAAVQRQNATGATVETPLEEVAQYTAQVRADSLRPIEEGAEGAGGESDAQG